MAILDTIYGEDASPKYVLATTALGFITLYQLYQTIYNIYFHPLRSFPGPLLHRASTLPWAIQHAFGIEAFATQKLHEKYGPVVRITPKHLSFTDPRAWRDIYGHQVSGKANTPELSKVRAFSYTIDALPRSIVSADREEHGRLRRGLSHGFSAESMRQQEPIIMKYIDLLLRRLHEAAELKKPINAEAYYNWTTFDIAGDLIFGMSFKCLDGSEYHPWIAFIFQTVKAAAVMTVMSYCGLHWLVQVMYNTLGKNLAIKNAEQWTNVMLNNRLNNVEVGRVDLFEGLVRKKEEWKLSFEQMGANAFILVLAGSETTATTLSGMTYLLLKHPEVMERVKSEVRGMFKSKEEIDMTSVMGLKYMLAVINESLRLYPPVATSLVREVPKGCPGGGVNIAGWHVPEGSLVEVQQWSVNHSKDNWEDPWAFKPERFLEESQKDGEEAGRNVLEALQAFSLGPRNCIGKNLAYAELRLILARMLFEFDLALAEDSKNWIERQKAYVLWDRIPLNVYLTPVKRG
ncbi:cytochrome P450 [Rhypophila decipiens]|uniref:Cytochrome P450 n=1 Tax=Rhypophila decipiens TaxID=261697 RepID=A0AAN6XYV4_9PEZI|nr:cytochrome P450 [Rhypophila decipiens]